MIDGSLTASTRRHETGRPTGAIFRSNRDTLEFASHRTLITGSTTPHPGFEPSGARRWRTTDGAAPVFFFEFTALTNPVTSKTVDQVNQQRTATLLHGDRGHAVNDGRRSGPDPTCWQRRSGTGSGFWPLGTRRGIRSAHPSSAPNGGDFTVAAKGSYTYDPPPLRGHGHLRFRLATTDPPCGTTGAGNDVTSRPAGIWFVDDSAAAGRDGRSRSRPLSTEPLCFSGPPVRRGHMFLYPELTAAVNSSTGNSSVRLQRDADGHDRRLCRRTATSPVQGGATVITTGAAAINGSTRLCATKTIAVFSLSQHDGSTCPGQTSHVTVNHVDGRTGGLLNLTGNLVATFPTITSTSSRQDQRVSVVGIRLLQRTTSPHPTQ